MVTRYWGKPSVGTSTRPSEGPLFFMGIFPSPFMGEIGFIEYYPFLGAHFLFFVFLGVVCFSLSFVFFFLGQLVVTNVGLFLQMMKNKKNDE